MRLAAALAALLSLCAAPVSADQATDDAIADFVAVCPAATLTPETMAEAATARGLTDQMTLPIGQSLRSTGYRTPDGNRLVSITEQRFSDATLTTCMVVVFAEVGYDSLTLARQQLEAAPGIGILEGRLLPMTGNLRNGLFKAEGTNPLITANFNTTATIANFTLSAWHIDAATAAE